MTIGQLMLKLSYKANLEVGIEFRGAKGKFEVIQKSIQIFVHGKAYRKDCNAIMKLRDIYRNSVSVKNCTY